MAKHCFFVCLLLLSGGLSAAQVPKYFIRDPGHGTFVSFGRSGSSANPAQSIRIQSIYTPADFPGAPSGVMTHLFVRITADTGKHADFAISIGYTTKTKFLTNGGMKNDTFITTLGRVFSRPGGYSVKKTDTLATWHKIPLDAGNFYYDKTKNFAVEFAYGPPSIHNGFCLYLHNSRSQTSLGAHRDSAYSKWSLPGVDFGFDIATTALEHVSNLSSFGMFPNPAEGGRFNISFDAKQTVANVRVSLTNAIGQQVFCKEYPASTKSFFKEVDISQLPTGTYFVEVAADDDRIARSVLVP